MKILFAVAEAAPFIKTGGLGEVAGSLPVALQRQGVDVRVIMPKYSAIPEHFRKEFKFITHFQVPVGWRQQYCGLEEMVYNGVHYYFIDNEYYFKRATLYNEFDQAEQFAFFSRAVLESLLHIPDFQPDILHCHDWHTAMIPLMLREFYRQDPCHFRIRTVLTIHNLKYQGVFPREVLSDILGLSEDFYQNGVLEFHGAINFLKAGLIYSDRLTTVSPTYAREIQTEYYGEHLEGVLRERSDRLIGIVNGLDYDVFNPDKDPYVKYPFSSSPDAKQKNKDFLQKKLGLPEKSKIPMLGMVSRLVDQKGLDLVAHVLEEILALDIQFVVLGTGDANYENMMRYFAHKYPQKVAARILFDDELAHQIYAGADLFLMPSRFEPCGMAQMMAMRYGTIPVVRNTGGLSDTVIPCEEDPQNGNGYRFYNYNAHDFLFTVKRAVQLFREDQQAWDHLMQNAMNSDFSWDRSARAYLELYDEVL